MGMTAQAEESRIIKPGDGFAWPDWWVEQQLYIGLDPRLQAIELQQCQDGWDGLDYWLSYYVVTVDEHDEKHPFKPLPYLEKKYMREIAYEWYHSKQPVFIKKSRQIMITWLLASCTLWDAWALKGRRNGIQSKKEQDADATLRRAWVVYDNMPFWLRQVGATLTYCHITFPQTRSVIDAMAQGPDQVRQYTYSNIFSDEMGFQDSAEDAYIAAQPSIKGGGKYIAVSSANPGFHDDMVEDNTDSEFHRAGRDIVGDFQPIRGVTKRDNQNGVRAILIHYTADPAKDPATAEGLAWYKEARKGFTDAGWRKEMEMDAYAMRGTLVYPTFDREWHTCARFEIPKHWTRFMALDPGLANPTAALWGAMNPDTGVIYLYDEYYVKEKTIREHASAIKSREGTQEIRWRVLDPSSWTRDMKDKRSIATEYEACGLFFDRGSRDEEARIAVVRDYLKYTPELGHTVGNPRLQVFNDLDYFLWEISKWKYPKQSSQVAERKNPSEKPEDKDNHLMDCFGLLLHERPRGESEGLPQIRIGRTRNGRRK